MLFEAGAFTLLHVLSQHLLQTLTRIRGADHPDSLGSRHDLATLCTGWESVRGRPNCTSAPSPTAFACWVRTGTLASHQALAAALR